MEEARGGGGEEEKGGGKGREEEEFDTDHAKDDTRLRDRLRPTVTTPIDRGGGVVVGDGYEPIAGHGSANVPRCII